MITVKPYGGLANRLRVIDSSYQLAQELNQEIEVIWEMSSELNCAFSKLFRIPDDIKFTERALDSIFKKGIKKFKRLLLKLGFRVPFGYDKYFIDDEVFEFKNNPDIINNLRKYNNIYIETVHLFFKNSDSYTIYTPVEDISRSVNTIRKQFTSNTIGIHIRRTDNVLSIKHSPLSEFKRVIETELSNDSNVRFFLATDSPPDEEELKREYPGKIITYQKEISRNSEKGIQDALVDLLCLAATKKIIGSYYSSFSDVASYMGGIELKLIYSADKT